MIWTDIEFAGFDWDSGNSHKVLKHGVSIKEIEEILSKPVLVIKDKVHSQKEERFVGVGEGYKGRVIFISFTYRLKGAQFFLRVISARYIHGSGPERESYEKNKKNR